ncbi:hypothetical protein MNEG_15794, partial [Monoraphidium neglectum]
MSQLAGRRASAAEPRRSCWTQPRAVRAARAARTRLVAVRAEQANTSITAQLKAATRPVRAAAKQLLERRGGAPADDTDAARPPPAAERLQASFARPQTVALSAAAFATVAAGVFGPAPILLPIDAAAHAFVAASTTPEWRLQIGERVISDVPIYLGLAAWPVLATVAAAAPQSLRRRGAALASLGASWALFVAGAGAVLQNDPPLVSFLKHAFARARPSNEIHHSFSFPSGHTTAAVFISGAALLVLLPLARRRLGAGAGASGGSGRLPDAVALPA